MVTVHYSGNITRHPDTSAAYHLRMDKYDNEGKCKYGVSKHLCQDYIDYEGSIMIKPRKINARCTIGNCGLCPRYRAQVEHGKKEKVFMIKSKHYQEIADRTAYLKEHSTSQLLFLTLTFPEYKIKFDEKDRKKFEQKINGCFSRFAENLQRTYNCTGYVAVREGDGINKRYHYHLIAAIPFVDIRRLNNAWCSAISNVSTYSKNALTTDRKARVIKNTVRAVKYICKYISKGLYEPNQTRVIFTDRATANAEIKRHVKISIDEIKERYPQLKGFIVNDYCVKYSIDNPDIALRFLNDIVFVLFGHYGLKNHSNFYTNAKQGRSKKRKVSD